MPAPTELPKKLNLGCGYDIRPGYLNVDVNDFHKPDLVCDVTNLRILPSDYFEEVVAQDVLEHIPRTQVPQALREWHRLVRGGGDLLLRIPNLHGLLELLRESGRQGMAEQKTLVQCLYGTQAYEGDFHLAGFTPKLLCDELLETGFSEVRIAGRDGWLMDVRARKGPVQQTPFPEELMRNDAVCISGWYQPEDYAGQSYRWSMGRSLINILRANGREAHFIFRTLDPKALREGLRARLVDAAAGALIADLSFTSHDPVMVTLPIATDDFLIELTTETTFMPGFFLVGSTDSRHLGAGLQSLHVG